MEENSSPTPQSPLQPQHKEFFIIGSLFTLLSLLTVAGILYFQNISTSINGKEAIIEQDDGYLSPYSKNATSVFYENKIIAGADPASFVSLTCNHPFDAECFLYYAKDKNHAYINDQIWNGVDAETLVYLGNRFFKDKNHAYHLDSIVSDDPANFAVLSERYSRDLKSVYQLVFPIIGADSATFELSSTTNSFDAQDKNHKYLNGKVVATTTTHALQIPEGADPATYVYDEATYTAKDKNYVWIDGEVPPGLILIPDADPKTFTPLHYPYSKDAKSAYCFDKVIASADVSTFRYVGKKYASLPEVDYGYAADKNTVYYCTEPKAKINSI